MSMLIALAVLAQPTAPAECSFMSFSRAASNRAPAPLREQVCISHMRDAGGAASGDYLLRRTSLERGSSVVTWASSRRCPAVEAQLAALEDVQLPTPDVPGLGKETVSITLDGVSYSLEALAHYGGNSARVALQSNRNTPLARWIEATVAVLEPCWRERPDAA